MSDTRPTAEKTAYNPPRHVTPPARFSHGVAKGGLLQVAGQVAFGPVDPGETPTPVGPGLREQTLQVLENVRAVLAEAGASWEDALMVRVYLTDTAHFAEFNAIWDDYFADLSQPPSARTTIYVGLPAGLLVEIDALAVL